MICWGLKHASFRISVMFTEVKEDVRAETQALVWLGNIVSANLLMSTSANADLRMMDVQSNQTMNPILT